MKMANGKCPGCKPSKSDLDLLKSGECTPEELWGGREPSCPDCFKSGSTEPCAPGIEMPSPGDHELASPIFEAIWRVVKSWDIAIPGRYHGYCGANGSHALLILQGIKSAGVSLENLQDDAVQKMHAEVLQLKAENKSLHSEKHTVECRFEVSEDTLSTIRGCLRSAEADIDKLKAENEALRNDLESHKRMLLAAACDIGAIGEALGADMDDDGSAIEGLAQELRQKAECVDDCAHLIRKLVHCRRQLATDDGLAEKALDYLKRNGLQGSPLRADEVGHD